MQLTLGKVNALWALTPGDAVCQGIVYLPGVHYEGLQPGNWLSYCEHWGFSICAPAKWGEELSGCHTLEHKVGLSYGTASQLLCSETHSWEGNELLGIWRWAMDTHGGWHSAPHALQRDPQFWLAVLSHSRKGSPGEKVSGTSWKLSPSRVCGREGILK